MMIRRSRGGVRMPLVGCLALIGVLGAIFVLVLLTGYAKVKAASAHRLSVPLHEGQARAGSPPPVASTPTQDATRLPFTPPDGFVVRPVRRELPCGATVEAYLLIPTYDSPCGQ